MGAAASGVSTQMQAEHDPNAAFPWWVRFLAKGVAILGGFLSLFFGVLGLITLSATCMVAILLQMTAGAFVIALEAPFCCQFVDFIEKIARFSESRALWHKAAIYGIMGLIPIFLCIEINTVLGSGTIFASGVIYGFMALGKKADRNNMMAAGDPAWSPQVNQSNIP
uniref:Calcium channel flower n=1 Tax=Caenorhabditis tropicalis TaxID=1561998 RepID=A0A1I7TMW3_9PELO